MAPTNFTGREDHPLDHAKRQGAFSEYVRTPRALGVGPERSHRSEPGRRRANEIFNRHPTEHFMNVGDSISYRMAFAYAPRSRDDLCKVLAALDGFCHPTPRLFA